MKLILENDEFAASSDSLNQEEGRSEGQGSWDNDETGEDTESFDTESIDDSPDVLNDTEPDYPDEYEEPNDSGETEPIEDEDSNDDSYDDEEDDTEDTEQKNTPIENPNRVLKYSEYFSSI